MSKTKAIVCTTLLLIVIAITLTFAYFVENEEYGINLHNVIMSSIAYIKIGDCLQKFYEWLTK